MLLGALAFASLSARAADVTVEISLAAPDALEVSYALPPACKGLAFVNQGPAYQTIRASWQALDNCGTADGQALARGRADCGRLRFRVPASFEKVTGYPGAFPVGLGIFAHTSKYAVDASCGTVGYRFLAPGSIGIDGRMVNASAAVDEARGADMPVLLLPMVLPAASGTPSYFDPRMNAATLEQIRTVADSTIAMYRAALPDVVFKMPIITASLASAPGGPTIGGDGGDVMRLSLFNWPQQAGPEERAQLTLLVAHEVSHRFQMRDAVDVYPDARLIHEGGAEFLRWMASIRYGWLSRAQAARELDEALGKCLIRAGGKGWRALAPEAVAAARAEYSCGLAAYVYALAARQGGGGAFGRINDFYRRLKLGQAPSFEHAMECGADPACSARWLPRLLGKEPMRDGWAALFAQTGLAKPAPPGRAQLDEMMLAAMQQLIRADCDGASSTTPTADALLIDGMARCKTLRADLHVVKVAGLPLFGDHALPALVAACGEGSVTLGLKGGAEVALACAQPYRIEPQFYKVDIERVLERL